LFDDLLRAQAGDTYDYFDPVLFKELDGTLSHSAGEDYLAAVFSDPLGQQAGLMRRRVQLFFGGDLSLLLIHVKKSKLPGMSKMRCYLIVFTGNCYAHSMFSL
jgi:hypothetical protein